MSEVKEPIRFICPKESCKNTIGYGCGLRKIEISVTNKGHLKCESYKERGLNERTHDS